MQRALYERDQSFDNIFFVGVRTTRVFCRPSCPARKPRPENVSYFATASDALFAGFRPCKRCRPLDDGALPEWAQGLLKSVEADPEKPFRAAQLRARGIEPARARRVFLKHYGMTFHAYVRSRRLANALGQIRRGAPIDDIALGSGYQSHSGFRSAFGKTFGVTPGKASNATCLVTGMFDSPLGPMILAATDQGLCLAEFADRRMLETQFRILRRRLSCAIVPGSNAHLQQACQELSQYFAGKRRSFSVALLRPGTRFQQQVWDAVSRIPFSTTQTYEEIAQIVGTKSARAVGHANGMNRLAIFIPCHRVVTKQGTLGGYGGGLWRKKRLLEMETRQKI